MNCEFCEIRVHGHAILNSTFGSDEESINNKPTIIGKEYGIQANADTAYSIKYYNGVIKGKVDAYASKLVTAGLTLEDVEVVENGTPVAGIKGRLMWGTDSSGEVQSILGSSLTNKNDIVYGPTGAKLNYWLGSPYEFDSDHAWYVGGDGPRVDCGYVRIIDYSGLRPVIKVLQSNF